ncbi:unnamed protein product [Diatraea saccharalis]|uniref:Protein SAAL1 n=1 Tax=Diatraea saccharalis TaxID=40085 RepID=A0A9N9QWA3_9NEOP|nr:unnamed protein product [Diatraea saccharalis]
MKPDAETLETNEEADASVAGDAIGDTVYSERFVLKILLKLANLDSLKDEVKDKSFEDDLCTLWDMTADKDVVLFLQKHDVLNLFNFALPTIETPRIIEIIVGIIGNMCCQRIAVAKLIKMENFLRLLLEYIKTDDSLVLIQLLRLVSSALFLAECEDIPIWMNLFESVGYSEALYFILKNSSHKQLLITAIENTNSVCSYCNTDNVRTTFYARFVNVEAVVSLTTAFTEVVVNQKESCEKEELERVLLISLQITLNMVGFENASEKFHSCKDSVLSMIKHILLYYEDKLINQKEIDTDLVDIVDSTITIVNLLQLSESSAIDVFFVPCHNMWKAMSVATKSHQNGNSDFEDSNEDLAQISKEIKLPLCNLLCGYVLKCSETHLLTALDVINGDYEIIVCEVDSEIRNNVSRRATNYRTRLKEIIDS